MSPPGFEAGRALLFLRTCGSQCQQTHGSAFRGQFSADAPLRGVLQASARRMLQKNISAYTKSRRWTRAAASLGFLPLFCPHRCCDEHLGVRKQHLSTETSCLFRRLPKPRWRVSVHDYSPWSVESKETCCKPLSLRCHRTLVEGWMRKRTYLCRLKTFFQD